MDSIQQGQKLEDEIADPLLYIPRYFKVLTKPDENKISKLVPMKLWPSQRHYIQNRTQRDIILKNRQTGMSTGIMAANDHLLFTVPYQRQILITHDDDTSEFLFLTTERFYNNLPPEIKPRCDWKSGRRIRFPSEFSDGTKGMDSYISVDSAKSDSLGIGRTLNVAHLSEMAKWPPRKEMQLYADISQTVSRNGYITIESTPKGRGNLFYQLYQAAKAGENNYKAFFYPWWWDVTCVAPITEPLTYTKDEQQLINYAASQEIPFYLTPEQIQFRREKIAELRIGDLFFQEYPENDTDCWLSSDMSVFDGVALRRYLQQVRPGRTEGHLTIWKDVIGGEKYVIGCDPAGGTEKGDWSVASVLNRKKNEYVARLRGKIPPDLFAQELLRLGERYNMAELGVEKEMHGHTVLHILMESNYPEIYYHEDYDTYTGEASTQPGWRTTGKTKPIMIDTMATALRANDIELWSENFCQEASGFVWDGQKTRCQPGEHDDELDALMIALQLREQAPISNYERSAPVSYVRI